MPCADGQRNKSCQLTANPCQLHAEDLLHCLIEKGVGSGQSWSDWKYVSQSQLGMQWMHNHRDWSLGSISAVRSSAPARASAGGCTLPVYAHANISQYVRFSQAEWYVPKSEHGYHEA